MRTKASLLLGVLLLMCSATAALAVQYPPGTSGGFCVGPPFGAGCPYPDTLIRISFIQDPGAVPHPVPPDTVWGIGGIIIGFDPIPTGFAVYVQNSDGNAYGGYDLFTGGTAYPTLFTPALALGDSIVAYGRMDEFQGSTELRGFNSSAFNDPLPAVRRVSTGNALPKFKRGTVNFYQELPTNPNAELWEECLVRTSSNQHKLRVAKNSDTGGLGQVNAFLLVDNVICPTGSIGPCDTLFVDANTLANIQPLPVGALVDSVQGIYNQATRGYRIMIRDGNDLFDSSPPQLVDAYSISNGDSIRVVFDRGLTQASAENTLNFVLTSTGFPVDGCKRQPDTRVVHCKVTNGLAAGDPEGVTVNGVVNAANNQQMTSADTRNFANGVMTVAKIQKPSAAALAGSPCDDRSAFSGPGNQNNGGRISTRGVCTIAIGSTYWIQDLAGGPRSGVAVFAPLVPLTVGRKYLIAGAAQEFFGETEVTGTVFVKDEGVAAPPSPIIKSIAVLRDTSCDATQSVDNGEDYEGCLVTIQNAKIVDERTAGQNFFVAGPYPSNPDTFLVDNNVARTFDPNKNHYVNVTGVLDVSFATVGTLYRLQPRNNADIVLLDPLAVEGQLPDGVSFAVTSPSRTSHVTFALPKRDRVQIGVYDLVGRRLAVLADGEFTAGPHTLDWNGKDIAGNPVASGVYFYKLKVSGQTINRRGVLLN
jgi:hypothetical protein